MSCEMDGGGGGKPQSMNFASGIPKGLRIVLEERCVNTRGKIGTR